MTPDVPTPPDAKVWMSLLDYFAAHALQGLLAAHADPDVLVPAAEVMAAWAYNIAAAMLEERAKR